MDVSASQAPVPVGVFGQIEVVSTLAPVPALAAGRVNTEADSIPSAPVPAAPPRQVDIDDVPAPPVPVSGWVDVKDVAASLVSAPGSVLGWLADSAPAPEWAVKVPTVPAPELQFLPVVTKSSLLPDFQCGSAYAEDLKSGLWSDLRSGSVYANSPRRHLFTTGLQSAPQKSPAIAVSLQATFQKGPVFAAHLQPALQRSPVTAGVLQVVLRRGLACAVSLYPHLWKVSTCAICLLS